MAEAMSAAAAVAMTGNEAHGDTTHGLIIAKQRQRQRQRQRHRRDRDWHGVSNIPNRKWSNCTTSSSSKLELEDAGGAGGKMVVELVGAFNQLAQKMSSSSSSEAVVFDALKLSIPLLRALPLLPGGRPPLSRALSVALLLADLRMDAEVISAALLRHPLRTNALSFPLPLLRSRLGPGTAHLLHDSLRLSTALSSHLSRDLDLLRDDRAAADLRRFCLTFYDARALALELALALDAMTHDLPHLPRFQQHLLSLRALKIHAPLAHALGLSLSLQLEDLSFRCLFPCSYLYLDAWLRTHAAAPALLDACQDSLLRALRADPSLSRMVSDVTVAGRYKSRYSTMKKLLKDGRRPEEVNDILGLRVVLHSPPTPLGLGEAACYRTRDVVRHLWTEVSHRTKDYIANPKPNGYRSLHMAVDVNQPGRPLMEVQIRTAEMDSFALGGAASHSFYKAGLTDPQQAKRLKAIMVAAAELAALRLNDLPSPDTNDVVQQRDRVFRLLDKNGDGRISIDELKQVMEELGAPGEDARHMMHLLDSNSDGSLSSDEFDNFQRQVDFMRSVEDTDDDYKTALNEKLQFAQETVREWERED